jgi:hypothetical protein
MDGNIAEIPENAAEIWISRFEVFTSVAISYCFSQATCLLYKKGVKGKTLFRFFFRRKTTLKLQTVSRLK